MIFGRSRPAHALYAIWFALILCTGAGVACHAPAPGQPADEAPPIAAPLRVGTSGDYPPFSEWPTGAAEPSGFSIEVARAYARDRGRPIEWIPFAWPELQDDLEADHFDLALSGVTVRPDRSVAGRFSVPLATSGAVVLVEAASALRGHTDLERAGLRMAVNAGGHLERVARSLFPAARIFAVAANDRVLDRLGRDAVVAIMTDSLEAPLWQARRAGLRAIGPLTRDRKAAWLPRSREALARDFDRWLMGFETSGELAGLRARFGLPATETARPMAALLASLDERLSLMTGVARAKIVLARAIEDRPREARVVESALAAVSRAAAREAVVPPPREAVVRFYEAQIEAAKWIQRAELGSRTSLHRADPTKAPASEAASEAEAIARDRALAELDEGLRPALIFLGDRIATLLIAASTDDRSTPPSFNEVREALARHELPEDRLRPIHTALLELVRDARRSTNDAHPSQAEVEAIVASP